MTAAQLTEQIQAYRDARARLLALLWHHQGGSSEIGQSVRKALGIGEYHSLSVEQEIEAKRGDALRALSAEQKPVAWRYRVAKGDPWALTNDKPKGDCFQVEPLGVTGWPADDEVSTDKPSKAIGQADEGVVRVPVEPTEEMVSAYLSAQHKSCFDSDQRGSQIFVRKAFVDGYKAMLAACAQPQTQNRSAAAMERQRGSEANVTGIALSRSSDANAGSIPAASAKQTDGGAK